jgi:hypothetical protein
MTELKIADKLLLVNQYNGKVVSNELYCIIRVNKNTYTLNNRDSIKKESLNSNKIWLERFYIIPTEKDIENMKILQIYYDKQKYLKEFIQTVKESNDILKFYLEHKESLQLKNEIIEEIEYAVNNLTEQLKDDLCIN